MSLYLINDPVFDTINEPNGEIWVRRFVSLRPMKQNHLFRFVFLEQNRHGRHPFWLYSGITSWRLSLYMVFEPVLYTM